MRLVVEKNDELIYGPVLITKGPHKGKVGYYDDEDEDDNLIIYPDLPIHCTAWYTVSRTAATSVIPTKRLAERVSEIDEELYKNYASPVRPCTELGFYSPERPQDARNYSNGHIRQGALEHP